jgi:hypothetical protein
MNSLAIILITIVVTELLLEAAGWRVPRGARIRVYRLVLLLRGSERHQSGSIAGHLNPRIAKRLSFTTGALLPMSAVFDADCIFDAPASPTRSVYPGIGSPVPAKCPAGGDLAHRAEPEVRQRRGPVAASLLERTSESRIYEDLLSRWYLTTPPASR